MAGKMTERSERNSTNVRPFAPHGEANEANERNELSERSGGERSERTNSPLRGEVRFVRSKSFALASLADRVRHLRPSHRDPELFHIEKSEIEHALRRLAQEIA